MSQFDNNNLISKSKDFDFETIVNCIKDFIFILDLKGSILYVNKLILEKLKYSGEELLNKNFLLFHPQEQHEKAKVILTELISGNRDQYDFPFITKDSQLIYIDTKITKVKWGDKNILFGISRDITQNKSIIDQLKKSEVFYRLIAENANDLIRVHNGKFNIEYVNEVIHLKILGYSKKELIGKFSLFLNHPNDYKIIRKNLRNLVKTGEGVYETRLRHKNGTYLWFDVKVKVFKDEKGNQKYLFINRDITERKKTEEALKESYYRADLYKDLFVHDMNNILQNVLSAIELISLYLHNEEKINEIESLFDISKEQISRGKRLILNVQKLSRLEETQFSLELTELIPILNAAIKYLIENNQNKMIDIMVNNPFEEVFVQANEHLIDVFENILINAVTHNQNQIIEIRIEISKIKKNNKKFFKINFIDNGMGIPNNRKKTIFEKAVNKKSITGLGIGLSLVKKIIENFNGTIWVEDKVEGYYSQGSNFIILIPEAD